MNCSLGQFPPLTAACGIQGQCVDGRCVCNDGYTNLGDFSLSATYPCDLNIAAIIGLYAGSIFVAILNLRVAVWGISSRQISLRTWRGWVMAALSILQSSIMITLAILKIVNTTQFIVGGDVYFTLLHGFFIVTLAAHLSVTLSGFIRAHEISQSSTLGPDQKREYRLKVRKINLGLTVVYIVMWPVSFIPLALLSRPDLFQVIIIIHGVPLIFFLAFMGGYFAPRLLASMLRGVQTTLGMVEVESTKWSQLERIAFKLRLIKILATVAFPCVSAIIVILVFWPYMTIKASYALPFLYSLANGATMLTIWSAITTSENAIRRPSLPFLSRFFPKLDSPDLEVLKKGAGTAVGPDEGFAITVDEPRIEVTMNKEET